MMTRVDPLESFLPDLTGPAKPHAVVVGAGLGGLAAAMRLGAKRVPRDRD